MATEIKMESNLINIYPYHLVEFVSTGRKPKVKNIDIVATKWLDYNNLKKKCTVKYPPPPYTDESSKTYNQKLILLSDYGSDWLSYTVNIKGRAKSLNEAYSKCEKLKEKATALTLESDEEAADAEQKAAELIKQAQLQAISKSMKEKVSSVNQLDDNHVPGISGSFNNNNKKTKRKASNESTDFQNQIESDTLITIPSGSKSNANYTTSESIVKNYAINKKIGNNIPTPNQMETDTYLYDAYRCSPVQTMIPNKKLRNAENDKLVTILHEVKELRTDINFIQNQLQQIQTLQEQKLGISHEDFCGSIVQINKKYDYQIPFESVRDFQIFDDALKIKGLLNQDVSSVLQTGMDSGMSISKSIVNMLKLYLSKNVAMKYVAVKKKSNKFIMKKTNFFHLIEVIIKERREKTGLHTNDKEIITALSNVLSNSVSWYKCSSSEDNNTEQENILPNGQYNSTPKIIATGTISNGVFQLDDNLPSSLIENLDYSSSSE